MSQKLESTTRRGRSSSLEGQRVRGRSPTRSNSRRRNRSPSTRWTKDNNRSTSEGIIVQNPKIVGLPVVEIEEIEPTPFFSSLCTSYLIDSCYRGASARVSTSPVPTVETRQDLNETPKKEEVTIFQTKDPANKQGRKKRFSGAFPRIRRKNKIADEREVPKAAEQNSPPDAEIDKSEKPQLASPRRASPMKRLVCRSTSPQRRSRATASREILDSSASEQDLANDVDARPNQRDRFRSPRRQSTRLNNRQKNLVTKDMRYKRGAIVVLPEVPV